MRILTAVILNLFLVTNTIAVIYEWQDSGGNKHYGNECPYENCTEVQLKKPTTYRPKPVKAQPIIKPQIERQPEKKGLNLPVETYPVNIKSEQCNVSIADTIGPGMVDPYRATESRKPTTIQYSNITRLLEKITGLWTGTMVEKICKGTEKMPLNEHNQYNVNLKVTKDLKGRYDFLALLHGDNKKRFQEKIRILIKQDKFHSGEGDILTDSKQWAVKLLKAEPGELIFARQFRSTRPSGGSQSHMILRLLSFTRGTLQLKELQYSHDKLWRIRTMILK